MRDTCSAHRSLPCRLDPLERLAVEREHEALRLTTCAQQVEQSLGKRNLTAFTAGGLAVRHTDQPPIEVHMLPSLGEDLTAPHSGVERGHDHVPKVLGGHR